ncbi:MAG: hypothetical protein H6849_02755 [Alphaproteobacteria bacterium]|nr:MAG: hypothetical protein H6849_02755 [Alphaproteobacteria bacterium]
MGDQTIFAAIDLGSNTCRLSVKSLRNGIWKVLHAYSFATRLGTDLTKGNAFDDSALRRTVHVFAKYMKIVNLYHPHHMRAVATEACRVADNSHRLCETIRKEHNVHLDIITAEEEAYLSFCGCFSYINPRKSYAIVFDIGGGSTEVVLVENDTERKRMTVCKTLSLPFGVVRLTDDYGQHIPRVLENIRHHVRDQVLTCFGQHFLKNISRNHKLQLVGCSGTATTAAGLALGLPVYDREQVNGAILRRTQLLGLENYLLDSGKLLLGSLMKGSNLTLVPPGLAILLGICDACPVPSVRVVDQGVRDGVIVDLALKHKLLQLPYEIIRSDQKDNQLIDKESLAG